MLYLPNETLPIYRHTIHIQIILLISTHNDDTANNFLCTGMLAPAKFAQVHIPRSPQISESPFSNFSATIHSYRTPHGTKYSQVKRITSFGKWPLPEKKKECLIMSYNSSNNRINVPEAKQAMDQFKMQAANEVGVDLKQGYNGNLTSREAGSVGGQMVKKMVEAYEQNLTN